MRVKRIRTKNSTVRIISARGKPDRIEICAHSQSIISMTAWDKRIPKPAPPLDPKAIDWAKLFNQKFKENGGHES